MAQMQLEFLNSLTNSNGKPLLSNLSKKNPKEIDELYTKYQLIEALTVKGLSFRDLHKWSLDKLRKEHKKYLIDQGSIKDISDSLLFDILSKSQ